mmetsp:Transcript_72467/g.151257  ORF Transcript_72467/g.151257 Transcript_72467/m.151257 type:complete len:82 (-) Transcript_72467:1073-1318(-)
MTLALEEPVSLLALGCGLASDRSLPMGNLEGRSTADGRSSTSTSTSMAGMSVTAAMLGFEPRESEEVECVAEEALLVDVGD